MERDIKPTYDELESYIERLNRQCTDAQATIAELMEALECALTEKPLPSGEYVHLVSCNGDRRKPAGTVGISCSCRVGRATIAALEQRVKELKQWVQDQSTANLETMRHMDEMQSRAMDAESQLTQRTAELEAAQRERDEAAKDRDDWITSWRALQRHNERIEAELERVRDQYADLGEMVLALPKVEGEIVAQGGYVKDRNKVYACFGSDADMTAYTALLQHRQGMEG